MSTLFIVRIQWVELDRLEAKTNLNKEGNIYTPGSSETHK